MFLREYLRWFLDKKKALFILFKGFFDTVDFFCDEIEEVFKKKGLKTYIIHNHSIEKDIKRLFAHFKDNNAVVITFNNIGFNLGQGEESNLWDDFNIPYINILLDHPFHFHSALPNLPKTTFLYVIDQNHKLYLKRYYPNIEKVKFLPHAGAGITIEKLLDEERDIDILYAGNLSKALVENLIPDFEKFERINGIRFFENVLKRLIENPNRTTEDIIEEELLIEYEDFCNEEILDYINSFRFLDGFAVSYFRELSVRILVENGFKVNVLGLGWEDCEWSNNKNLILMGRVNANKVPMYMKRSKIVLNTLTWFKAGAHDRIFNGQLAGACVLTDKSTYLEEIFNKKEVEFFSLKEIVELPQIVENLLNDDKYRQKIAINGMKSAKTYHTWQNRVDMILEDLKF